jgi:hypothetical protein
MKQKNPKTAHKISMSSRFLLILTTIAVASFSWIVSGIFHEFGHALAVLAFGGHITELQPFVPFGAPHIAYIGSFTEIQVAIISVSGAGIVFLIGILTLLLFPFERVNSRVRLAVASGVVPFVAQSISFMILPVLHLVGLIIHDDVITFLESSQLQPLLVSFIASMITALGALILIRRTRIISAFQTISEK